MKLFTKISLVSIAAVTLAACAGGAAQRSTGQTIDDGLLTGRVKTALIENDQTKARQIDVEVYRGEVQLNGFVDSEVAKSAANATAKNVEGVKSVRNNLQIRAAERSAGQVIDDGVISARVNAALVGDARTRAYQIEVKTNAGVVQLGGFVDSATSKAAAAELARSIDGVKSVSNELQVKN